MKYFYTILLVSLMSTLGYGQEIVAISGRQSSQAATVSNISAVPLSRGSGINSTGATTFNSNGWTFNSTPDANDYIEWSVTADPGFIVTINNIEIDYDRSNTGPSNTSIRTSLDGYTTDIFTDTSVNASGEIVNFSTNLISSDGGTITFRLFAYNASNTSGTFDIEDDLGTVLGQSQVGVILSGIVASSNDADTEIFEPSSQISSATVIAANTTSSGTAFDILGFVIEDQGTSDGLPTNVTTMRFVPGTNNTADWTDHIQGITLIDGDLNIYTPTVTISDTELLLDFGTAITIPDGMSLEFLLGLFLNTNNIVDGSIIQMEISDTASGFVAEASGSNFIDPFTLGAVIGNNFTIDVDADQLRYIQQPSDVLTNAVMTPAVEIAYTDTNGNIDTDYDGSGFDVSLTTSGSFDASATTTATALNGVAIFNNLIFDAVGTSITLSASDDSTFISGTFNSTTFNVTAAPIIPELIITEIMQNPDDVGDAFGEYFEVYNPTETPIDMNGWIISDNDSDSHTISSSVIVPAFGFAVLGFNNDPLTNGGVIIDYVYPSTFQLANVADEIVLTDGDSNEIDRVEYDGGTLWPNPEGAAMIYIGSDIENNNDGMLWAAATVSEGIDVDFGSPGINGTDQIVAYLVFSGGAWNTVPSPSTGLRTGLIKSDESTSFSSDVNLTALIIEEGADLTIDSGATCTITDITLMSTSSSYSSLIRNGIIAGTVHYERFVNQISSGGPGNDLVSVPLTEFDLNFQSFLDFGTPTNRDILATNTANTIHAFGPYDNTGLTYINYPTYSPDLPPDPAAEPLILGKGYRAASTNGDNITFTGNILSTNVSIDITTPTTVVNSQWNLIGNPYPSFLDAAKFLAANNGPMEDTAEAIYAYNSATYSGGAATTGNFTIINALTISAFPGENFNIAPGQGFFVPADITPGFSGTINFVTGPTAVEDMRTTSGTDDYIVGRSTNVTYAVKLSLASNSEVTTSIFFNNNATRDLDPGYDAATFGGSNFFSHLVENNTGLPMALQALSLSDMSDVTIPLGVNANQGQQLTFSIAHSTLPESVEVYLEDTESNTITLLNTSSYVLTPISDLNGTGRFFLRFSNTTLSDPEASLDKINIYTNQKDKTIVIEGQLLDGTKVLIYDLQGRLVNQTVLSTSNRRQNINVSHLNASVYIVELKNISQSKTKKIILN